ncbi:hypothetical protein DV738_g5661, partial [Chaetothyriales sp. CBS 135597]
MPTPLPSHLSPSRSIHVIISTKSGTEGAQQYYDNTLRPILDAHNVKPIVHTTTSTRSIIDLTRQVFSLHASRGIEQTILLLSGDGGLVDIVDTLHSHVLPHEQSDVSGNASTFVKPTILLFPLGTANAWAWSAGVASDPIKTLLEGKPKPLPSFEARFSPGAKLVTDEGRGREELPLNREGDVAVVHGAVVASWGLHASLVAMSDTAEYRKHGIERFKMVAGKLLQEAHVYKGLVRTRKEGDGGWEVLRYPDRTPEDSSAEGEREHQHAYVLCTLVSNLEEKFRISPATKSLEGVIRLVAIRPDGPLEVMRLLGLAYQGGKHVEEQNVVYEAVESIRVELEEDEEVWRQVCIDGKIIAVPKGGWFEVSIDTRTVAELVFSSESGS